MGPQLEAGIEEDLKLEFRTAGVRDLEDLKRDLDTASKMLGADPEELKMPERGFLASDLTLHQRLEINRLLGPVYAGQNKLDQEQLQKIRINESEEEMISLRRAMKNAGVNVLFSDSTFHEACGEYARKHRIWYVRRQVAEKLIAVTQAFNAINIKPHIEDCFRPPEVQEGLFFRRIAGLAKIHQDWDWQTVRTVGESLTAPVPGLAGHQAGAAVDLILCDRKGKQLDLGNDYPESGAISCINCPYVTLEQYKTRMRFAHIMRMGGFRLLPTEDWHISSGDRGLGIDGPLSIKEAIYGPVQHFSRRTGKVVPYGKEQIDNPYLSPAEVEKLIDIARIYDNCEDEFCLTQGETVAAFRQWLTVHRTGTSRG